MIDRELARRIKLVGLDIDGVMTDGGIYLGAVNGAPLEFKRYEIQDGLGVKFMMDAGVRVAIVTGRVSDSVRLRAAELGITDVAQDRDGFKMRGFRAILAQHAIGLDEVAFVGDDWPDVPILRQVALPVAVGNAVPEVRDLCRVHLTRRGGHGAVREFAETFLRARGEWLTVTERYIEERAGTLEVVQ